MSGQLKITKYHNCIWCSSDEMWAMPVRTVRACQSWWKVFRTISHSNACSLQPRERESHKSGWAFHNLLVGKPAPESRRLFLPFIFSNAHNSFHCQVLIGLTKTFPSTIVISRWDSSLLSCEIQIASNCCIEIQILWFSDHSRPDSLEGT